MKTRKIMIILLLIIICIALIPKNVFATDSIFAKVSGFMNDADTSKTVDTGRVWGSVKDIFNIIFPIGVAVTIIVGAILGIKIMIAPVDGKADAKKALVPFAISCAVIYGSIIIWKIAVALIRAF